MGSDDQTTADSEPERTPKEVTLRADFDVDLDGDGVVDGAGTLETTAVDIDGDGVADAIVERESAEFARLAGGPENLAAIEKFFSKT